MLLGAERPGASPLDSSEPPGCWEGRVPSWPGSRRVESCRPVRLRIVTPASASLKARDRPFDSHVVCMAGCPRRVLRARSSAAAADS
jgi:hypothetical protein